MRSRGRARCSSGTSRPRWCSGSYTYAMSILVEQRLGERRRCRPSADGESGVRRRVHALSGGGRVRFRPVPRPAHKVARTRARWTRKGHDVPRGEVLVPSSPAPSTTRVGRESRRSRPAPVAAATSASRWRRAAAAPASYPHSSRIAAGHPRGLVQRYGQVGVVERKCSDVANVESLHASGGKWVIPTPSSSPTSVVPLAHARSTEETIVRVLSRIHLII